MSSAPDVPGVGSTRDELNAVRVRLIEALDKPGSRGKVDREMVEEAVQRLGRLVKDDSWVHLTDVALRHANAAISQELSSVYKNLGFVQARSTVIIEKARAWRKKIVELGGEDPGEP